MQILKIYGLRPDLNAMALWIMEVKSAGAHMDFISEGQHRVRKVNIGS